MFKFLPVRYIGLLLSSFLLFACAASDKQPEWVDSSSGQFPASQYLTAVGEGGNRETAASRARANLSKIFQVAISDTSQDFSQAIVASKSGQSNVENQQRVMRFVTADAQQLLEGSNVVEYWESPAGQIFGLAALDKAAASRRFMAAVNKADRDTAQLIDYASNVAPNPVVALQALESARLSQVERDNANRNLAITAGKGINARIDLNTIEAMIREALATLTFAVVAVDSDLQAELQGAVSSLGIQASAVSNYQLVGDLDLEPLQQKQGWWWLRGSLELKLMDGDHAIVKQRWPVKASSVDQGMVGQRLADSINSKLAVYLYQMLTVTSVK